MSRAGNHYAEVRKSGRNYRVYYLDELILQCDRALSLEEHHYGSDFPAVIYFPADAVAGLETSETDHSTYCPIKGDASYWSYRDAHNAIWCYRDPLPGVAAIKDHFAFDQAKGFRVTFDSA